RPRDGQRFVEGQIRPLALARWMSKRAVMANVAAKLRERNKNFARIRDEGAVGGVTPAGGRAHEGGKGAVPKGERVLAGESAVEVGEKIGDSFPRPFPPAALRKTKGGKSGRRRPLYPAD